MNQDLCIWEMEVNIPHSKFPQLKTPRNWVPDLRNCTAQRGEFTSHPGLMLQFHPALQTVDKEQVQSSRHRTQHYCVVSL